MRNTLQLIITKDTPLLYKGTLDLKHISGIVDVFHIRSLIELNALTRDYKGLHEPEVKRLLLGSGKYFNEQEVIQ